MAQAEEVPPSKCDPPPVKPVAQTAEPSFGVDTPALKWRDPFVKHPFTLLLRAGGDITDDTKICAETLDHCITFRDLKIYTGHTVVLSGSGVMGPEFPNGNRLMDSNSEIGAPR